MLGSMLIVAGILIVVGVILLGATIVMMAIVLLRPPRMTDGRAAAVLGRISPGDLGLHFQEMRFEVRDERNRDSQKLPIAAWWIPNANARGKCAVLIHGYADAKVGAIAWAPMWHSLGYNIFAPDLRAHGYSGGKYSTAGFFERHDLNQVLNELVAVRPNEARQIVLFGVSLGAAVALGAAEMRDDIDALVLECPYADYRHAIDEHARIMQMPLPSLAPVAVRVAEWISGADFRAVRPVDLLERVNIPVMVIDAADDPFVSREDGAAIERVMQMRAGRGIPSVYWRVEGASHVMGIVADSQKYERHVAEFLSAIRSWHGLPARV